MKMSCNENFSSGRKTFQRGPKVQFGSQTFLQVPDIPVWAPESKKVLCNCVARLPDPKILTFEGLQATAKAMSSKFVSQGVVMWQTKNFFIKKLTLQPVISVSTSTMLHQ